MDANLFFGIVVSFSCVRDRVISSVFFVTTIRSKIMSKFVTRFLNDESGATAIEYGLIAAGIAVAIIAAVNSVGSALTDKFDEVAAELGG